MMKQYFFILSLGLCGFCMGQKDTVNASYSKSAKQPDYQSCISKGDLAFSGKDYLTAKRFYKQALVAKPSEAYPKQQIDKCDDKMSSGSWMSNELNCPCHNPNASSKAVYGSDNIEMTSPDGIVYAVFPGKILVVSADSITHLLTITVKHGKYSAIYSNLSGTSLKQGDEVKEGDKIGYLNKNGEQALLFSILNGKEKEDPKKYVRCRMQ